jgi:hypothetical protein
MRKVFEYEQHANECREMARRMRNQHHKKQPEDMAKAWEMLASARASSKLGACRKIQSEALPAGEIPVARDMY